MIDIHFIQICVYIPILASRESSCLPGRTVMGLVGNKCETS